MNKSDPSPCSETEKSRPGLVSPSAQSEGQSAQSNEPSRQRVEPREKITALSSFYIGRDRDVDFVEHFAQAVTKFPSRIIALKFADIADPPNVVANPVLLLVLPF